MRENCYCPTKFCAWRPNTSLKEQVVLDIKNTLIYLQEVPEILKKTLSHKLDEIEAMKFSVAALHQLFQPTKIALKVYAKEHEVTHKAIE